MRRTSLLFSAAAAVLFATATWAPVKADTFDHQANLTFSSQVQIPGATLDAGTYRFRLADAATGRKVIQVLSGDGSHVYSMFHTMPDTREVITQEPTVTFMETPVGVAPPVKSLFYAGEADGYAFVYPNGGPNMTPSVWPQPPITYERIETTSGAIESPRPVQFTAEPAAIAAAPVSTLEPTPEPALPATASPIPLAAFSGGAFLLLGLGLGLIRRLAS